jgi:dipeptidyl-peptidase 4
MRLFLGGLLAVGLVGSGQGRAQGAPERLTVKSVNRADTGIPPQSGTWSPDGRTLAFIPYESVAALPSAKPGDIVGLDPETGRMRVLASAHAVEALGSKEISIKDRDHRERYGMASFLWSPDGRFLMLDKDGLLFLWDIGAQRGSLIVDTNSGSGEDPKFSPDGKTVSYLRGHNLYVHPVGAGAERALTTTPAGTEPDGLLNGEVDWVYEEELDVRTNYAWAPDSHALLYVQMDETRVPRYPIEDYIPVHSTVDWQRYPQAGDPNPAVRAGVVPVAGGPTKWLNVPLRAGEDYIPRFGWVNDHVAWVEVLERSHKARHVYLADANTGAAKLIQTDSDPKYLEDNYDLTFLPHGRFLEKSWRDGHMHLYLYSFDEEHPLTGEAKLERQLTSGEFEVSYVSAPAVKGEVTDVFFTSTEGSPLETQLWTIHLDGTDKRQVTAGKGTHEALIAPDGRYFVDSASALTRAATAKVCPGSGSGCRLLWEGKLLPQAAGTSTRIVPLKAADGKTTIYGYLTQPIAQSGTHSVPVILNPYGGPLPTAEVMDHTPGQGLRFDQLLAQHGFAVLELDGRGSGGRGRDFQQVDYRNFGAVQMSDQLSALDQLLAGDSRLDPKRVGWWGWSWGGFFTLYAMTHTDRIKAGVAVAPGSTDLRNYDSVYVERYMGTPAENAAAFQQFNVNEVAKNLKGRVLIAQGTGDDNVHMNNALQFVDKLITAEIPYDFQIFPRLTHSLDSEQARDLLFERIVYQFETYLK